MHISSYSKMKMFRDKYLTNKEQEKLVILDIGSQDVNGSYKDIFDSPQWSYLGVDMCDGKNVDIVLSDIYNWKEISSASIDVIVSGQAFEHIEFIWLTMSEISRVLKNDGLCCIIAPSSGKEHKYPTDCWRFYPDGLRSLAKYAELETLEAYTQWNDEGHDDGSDLWHDSVLIAQKSSGKPAKPEQNQPEDLTKYRIEKFGSYLSNYTLLRNEIKTCVEKSNSQGKSAVYGTGDLSEVVVSALRSTSPVALIDRSPEKINTNLFGLPVISIEQINDYGIDNIIIASFANKNEIKNRLQDQLSEKNVNIITLEL